MWCFFKLRFSHIHYKDTYVYNDTFIIFDSDSKITAIEPRTRYKTVICTFPYKRRVVEKLQYHAKLEWSSTIQEFHGFL